MEDTKLEDKEMDLLEKLADGKIDQEKFDKEYEKLQQKLSDKKEKDV